MGDVKLRDLAKKLELDPSDIAFRLKSVGVQVTGNSDTGYIDASIASQILEGKIPLHTTPDLGNNMRTDWEEDWAAEIDDWEARSAAEGLSEYLNWKARRDVLRAEREVGGRGFRDQRRERKLGNLARNLATLDEVLAFEHSLSHEYQEIVQPADPPEHLIQAVGSINAEMIRHLKLVPEDVHRLSPRQFEELIAEILASYGWLVQLTPKTKDGGYDIFAINNSGPGLDSAWLVECKKYRDDRPVGVEIVRSFWAVKANLFVPNGLIATTSRFTSGALKFKESKYDLALRDFESVVEWINIYRPHPKGQIYLRDSSLFIEKNQLTSTGRGRPSAWASNPSAAPDTHHVSRGPRR